MMVEHAIEKTPQLRNKSQPSAFSMIAFSQVSVEVRSGSRTPEEQQQGADAAPRHNIRLTRSCFRLSPLKAVAEHLVSQWTAGDGGGFSVWHHACIDHEAVVALRVVGPQLRADEKALVGAFGDRRDYAAAAGETWELRLRLRRADAAAADNRESCND